MAPSKPFDTSTATLKLRRGISHIPTIIYTQWRIDTLREIITLLMSRIVDHENSQRIAIQVPSCLTTGATKPSRNEFRAFWLHWDSPLRNNWVETLHWHGWQDLMDWSTDGPVTRSVSHDDSYRLMTDASKTVHSLQLNPVQRSLRQHLLGMSIGEIRTNVMGTIYPYPLVDNVQTLSKYVRFFEGVQEFSGCIDMAFVGLYFKNQAESGQAATDSDLSLTKQVDSGVVDNRMPCNNKNVEDNHTTPGKASDSLKGTRDDSQGSYLNPTQATRANDTNQAGTPVSGQDEETTESGPTDGPGTRAAAGGSQMARERVPENEIRIDAALASLGRQIKQLKRKHSDDMASLNKKHKDKIDSLERKHDDDLAVMRQDIENLKAENAKPKDREKDGERLSNAQLKDVIDGILRQEEE